MTIVRGRDVGRALGRLGAAFPTRDEGEGEEQRRRRRGRQPTSRGSCGQPAAFQPRADAAHQSVGDLRRAEALELGLDLRHQTPSGL